MEHNSTRWECSYETPSKDEFLKHCKNISKRVKWRDLIDNVKIDKDGNYRCVYYSTDRHHVENHYQKGSTDVLTPSPQQVMRYRSFMHKGYSGKKGKRDQEDAEDDDNISPEDTAREMKKLKQDASLLGFFQEQHMDANGEGKDAPHIPDNMKTADLINNIAKKLELGQEFADQAIEKLHKNGFTIVAGLKSLKKESWEKLALPSAIDEELKTQITQSRAYAPWYGMSVPFGWAFPHQGTYWAGQPVYMPYPNQYENQEAVLGMGEVSGDKDKEKAEDKDTDVSMEHLEQPAPETAAPMVTLVPPDSKREGSESNVVEEQNKA